MRSRLRAFPECLAACGAECAESSGGQEVSREAVQVGGGGYGDLGVMAAGSARVMSGRGDRGDPRLRLRPPPGRGLRQVRAGVHGPGRLLEEGSVRAGSSRLCGAASLLR